MKRAVLGVLCVVAVLLGAATASLGAAPIRVFVNGRELRTGIPPQLVGGRVLAPVRHVAEALGLKIAWHPDERRVDIASGLAALPEPVYREWWNTQPRHGELAFGYMGPWDRSPLPAVAALNAYLAERQQASLEPASGSRTQRVLVRYEILDVGFSMNPLDASETNTGDMAFELVARLYYSELPVLDAPPSTVRLVHRPGADFEQPAPLRSWYEDVAFTVRPVGEVKVVKDEASDRITWLMGLQGWRVDEGATRVLREVELGEMPPLFDLRLPPEGYTYTLVKEPPRGAE